MKVVILCGGRGTRFKEETEYRPKPMVKIGPYPLLWHIMKNYSFFGFNEFILCLGYKGEMIKEYFLNYEVMNNDFTIQLNKHSTVCSHSSHEEKDWVVTLADTGEDTQTGARIKRVEKYIGGDIFLATYGDGVANIDIKKLIGFHKAHGKMATITGVHPSSRFGELKVKEKRVMKFHEKPQTTQGIVNGGYFVFSRKFLDYLESDSSCILEQAPLEKAVKKGQLMMYYHEGFWQCVDTYRELELLNSLWYRNEVPWRCK